MRRRRSILLLVFVFFTYCSSGQLAGELMQSRILILLDGSSSMTQKWASGRVKYSAAQEVILRIIDSVYAVNNQVQFGLRMFGHQHTVPEHNCYDTRMEVYFSPDNRSQMSLRLQDIQPVGITPIAFALTEAANKDITDEVHYAYSIILITDGGESCGGDICDVMKKLLSSKVYFKPYIVSLENDPGLRSTYSCMGDYLQVTSDGEIPAAVKKIVDALRPAIKIKKVDYNEMQTIAGSAPSVLKVNVPVPKKVVVHKNDSLPVISESGLRMIAIPEPVNPKPKSIETSIKTPIVKIDTADIPKPVRISGLSPAGLKPFNIPVPVVKAEPMQGPFVLPQVKVDTPRATDNIVRLKPAPLRPFNVIFVLEDRSYPSRKVPALPPAKIDPADLVVVKPDPTKREVRVETSNDRETSLEIYFTNGSGTFYTSTPQVMLIDPKTKQVVKKFFRTVDPAGNPDPQTGIPPGTYDLTLVEKRDFIVGGITVEQDKKKKYFVKVSTASLSFAYVDALGRAISRPITEFSAEVIERNKAHGRVQIQKGTEKLQYEPGNYHITINTFPLDIRNVDLIFDAEVVIAIPQPGFAKFVGDGKTAVVNLWNRNGDRFVRLTSLSLADPRSQHLQLQPGEYQVHYQKGPGGSASEKVKLFKIRPTEETIIELD